MSNDPKKREETKPSDGKNTESVGTKTGKTNQQNTGKTEPAENLKAGKADQQNTGKTESAENTETGNDNQNDNQQEEKKPSPVKSWPKPKKMQTVEQLFKSRNIPASHSFALLAFYGWNRRSRLTQKEFVEKYNAWLKKPVKGGASS